MVATRNMSLLCSRTGAAATSDTSDRTLVVFFFNDTAPTEIYTLSLHDALPIPTTIRTPGAISSHESDVSKPPSRCARAVRSEEHTSELQSHLNLVCRLLLE